MSCKYIGLDFGEKTIGVAISHNGRVATGVTTLIRKDAAALKSCLKELKIILRENEIKNIVLGFPKNMDGEDSARCEETLAFKEKLMRYFKNINVILWDERLSTLAVLRVFDGKAKNRKKNVDQMAAVYILQGYLDYLNRKEEDMLPEEHEFDDGGLYLESEDGEKIPVQIVASKEDENGIYLLAITEDEEDAVLFKCTPSQIDPEDLILETIEPEDKDFDKVFAMFKADCDELGIAIEGEF
jgi:putative Holliday junction resolvase